MSPVQLLSRVEPLPEPLAVTAERPIIPVPAENLPVDKHLGIVRLASAPVKGRCLRRGQLHNIVLMLSIDSHCEVWIVAFSRQDSRIGCCTIPFVLMSSVSAL